MTLRIRTSALVVLLWAWHCAVLAQTPPAVEMPDYISHAAEKLAAELNRRQLPPPARQSCTEVPGPDKDEPIISCKLSTQCWSLGLVGVQGRLATYYFAGTVKDQCTDIVMDTAETAVMSAFVMCTNWNSRQEAIALLLEEPMDTTDPQNADELKRQQEAEPNALERFNIVERCKTMTGHRALSTGQDGGRLHEIWLSYVSPAFAPH